jgi:hypothetical protein
MKFAADYCEPSTIMKPLSLSLTVLLRRAANLVEIVVKSLGPGIRRWTFRIIGLRKRQLTIA